MDLLSEALHHRHRLASLDAAQQHVHGSGRMAGINRRLAVWITDHVGTMWAAYAFTLIALTGAVAVVSTNVLLVLIVNLVSQTFLQLVLLPVIMVGQQVQAAHSEERALADHETLQLLHEMNVTQLQILQKLEP